MDVNNLILDNNSVIPMCSERENELLKMNIAQLKAELLQAKMEIARVRRPPLIVCDVSKVLGDKAIVKLANGNQLLVELHETMKGNINAGDTVLAEQRSFNIVERLDSAKTCNPEMFLVSKKPTIKWADIGGLEEEIRELKEAIELPAFKRLTYSRKWALSLQKESCCTYRREQEKQFLQWLWLMQQTRHS